MTNAHLATKPCAFKDCPHPRKINSTGHVQAYCAKHLSEVARKSNVKKSQRIVKPRAAKVTPLAAADFKVCIIDYPHDLMLYWIDGTVTRRTHTHINDLKPGGFAALLASHRAHGWHIVERGAPTIAQHWLGETNHVK